MLFFIPDSIEKANPRIFSDDERRFLKARVESEVYGADDKKWRMSLFLDVLKDPLVYIYLVSIDASLTCTLWTKNISAALVTGRWSSDLYMQRCTSATAPRLGSG